MQVLSKQYNRIKFAESSSKYCGIAAAFTFCMINISVLIWQAAFAKIKNKKIDQSIEIIALLATILMLFSDVISAYYLEQKKIKLAEEIDQYSKKNDGKLDDDLRQFRGNFVKKSNLENDAAKLCVLASVISLVTEVLVVTQLFYDFGFDRLHGDLPINAEHGLYLICCVLGLVSSLLLLSAESKALEKKESEVKSKDKTSKKAKYLAYFAVALSALSIFGRFLKGFEATGNLKGLQLATGVLSFGYLIASLIGITELTMSFCQSTQSNLVNTKVNSASLHNSEGLSNAAKA